MLLLGLDMGVIRDTLLEIQRGDVSVFQVKSGGRERCKNTQRF
jgi:hypothetical protein